MKVLFLSVPTGQGHHQTAKAVLEHFKSYEDVECRFLDIMDHVSPILAESLQKGYLLSTKVAPGIYGRFYDLADRREPSDKSLMNQFLKAVINPKLMQYLKNYNPDIIVATHVFSAIAMTHLKRKYAIRAKVVAVVTDFKFHPYWEDAHVDYYITPSELLEFQAIQKGIKPEQIRPFGIPILPHFAERMEKEKARAELGLENTYTVLLMMGSMGYGNDVFDAIRSLNRMKEEFQLVVVCGNNKKLKARVDAMTKHKTVITYGFTNEVSTLMDAADCIITKPGGLSTSEAMAKNLPMIVMDPIPGQEDRNKEFFLNNGIAMAVSETFPVTEAVYQLIHFPHKAEMLKQNMTHIAKPQAVAKLGEFMLKLCKDHN